jgi:hypothetical protein
MLMDPLCTLTDSSDNVRAMMNMSTRSVAPPSSSQNSLLVDLFGYAPAATVSFRLEQLGHGDLADCALSTIQVPTLVFCSAKDRLLPSMQEGAHQLSVPLPSLVLRSFHGLVLSCDVQQYGLVLRFDSFTSKFVFHADHIGASSHP